MERGEGGGGGGGGGGGWEGEGAGAVGGRQREGGNGLKRLTVQHVLKIMKLCGDFPLIPASGPRV